jgi:isochorismate pyruvate lyase
MNPPAASCRSLAEIRAQIDRLDEQIVRALAERGACVLAAAQFKPSPAEVKAPDRVEQVVAHVRALAETHGANADVVERIYRELIAAFTDAEHQAWSKR